MFIDKLQRLNNHSMIMANRSNDSNNINTTTTIITMISDDDYQSSESDNETEENTEMSTTTAVHKSILGVNVCTPVTMFIIKIRNNEHSETEGTKNANCEFEQTVKQVQKVLNTFKIAGVSCNISNHFFHDDYIIKFNIDFSSQWTKKFRDLNKGIFVDSLRNTCQSLYLNISDLLVEFPFNSLHRMVNEIDKPNDQYNAKIDSFRIGSLLNLSFFISHLEITGKDCQIEMDFGKKFLSLHFQVNRVLYRIEISFVSIKLIMLELGEKERKKKKIVNNLYFELSSSPWFFSREESQNKKNIKWERIKDFSASYLHNKNNNNHLSKRVRPNGVNNRSCKQNFYEFYDPDLIGMALSYRITISNERNIDQLIKLGFNCKDLNKNFSFYVGKIQEILVEPMTMKTIHCWIKNYFEDNFAIDYACMVLFSKSYKMSDFLVLKNCFQRFLDHIKTLSESNESLVEECLYLLDTQCKNRIIDVWIEFNKLFNDRQNILTTKEEREKAKNKIEKDKRDHVVMRRALMTPSKIEYCRPISLLRSRFSNIANLDYALRLTVLEDDNRRLNNSSSDVQFIKNNIKPRLLNGIEIGDRLYEFLGSSSSQMRENGIIFYAKDDQNRTAQTIRDVVGNLTNFKRKVAKYIARFGLIFSQAIAYYTYDDQVKIFKANDILTENNKFCFSDGVGIISRNIAEKIAENLQIQNHYFPTAYQIRHGGCKGMLVCYDTKDNFIIFRESMIKYEASDNTLGILKYSAPRPVFLNRQLINILDQQNVPAEVFYEFFRLSTNTISEALLFEQPALRLIKTYRNKHIPYERLQRSGISLLKETFFRRVLNYLAFYRLNELKTKARVRVPETTGRCAFGVIDESKQLKYGQIFFQYTELDNEGSPSGSTVILDDEYVMVTKFPCMSLGDVRKLKAINVPKLHHIKDCIVFPADGNRPHTDEMGGSDLDGDEYAIFWRSKLIFSVENAPPMDFPTMDPGELNHDIRLDDIVDFYCDFLLENNIGQVANTHLIFSDFHPEGLRSDECLELARKYSISLDFQKNGVNSQLDNKFQNIKIRPDFMEKKGIFFNKVYLSNRILGQFFRHCCLIEDVINLSDQFLIANEENHLYTPQTNLLMTDWEKYKNEAEDAFVKYKYKIVDIMEQMDIESEAALLSDVYEDKNDASAVLLSDLFFNFQSLYKKQAWGKQKIEKLRLASAWYAICFEKSYQLQYQYHDVPLFGLPWMIPEQMIKVSNYTKNHEQTLSKTSTDCDTDDESRKELHLKLTTKLVILWMYKINFYIFRRQFQSVILYNVSRNRIVDEQVILYEYIKNHLKVLMVDNKDEYSKINSDRQAILYLFNLFMIFLYGMCNKVNEFIRSQDNTLENLFVVRYALFSLSFINKLDDKSLKEIVIDDSKFLTMMIDLKLPDVVEDQNINNNYQTMVVNNSDGIDSLKNSNNNLNKNSSGWVSGSELAKSSITSTETIKINGNPENSFSCDSYFNVLLENFLYNSDHVRESQFCVLKPKHKLDCIDKNFSKKLQFLAGGVHTVIVKENQPRKTNRDIIGSNGQPLYLSNMNNLDVLSIKYYTVNVKGYPASITFLRLLLGHTDFLENVYKKFNLPDCTLTMKTQEANILIQYINTIVEKFHLSDEFFNKLESSKIFSSSYMRYIKNSDVEEQNKKKNLLIDLTRRNSSSYKKFSKILNELFKSNILEELKENYYPCKKKLCFIINNKKFEGNLEQERIGSEIDVKKFKETFENFDFDVQCEMNLSKAELLDKLENMAIDEKLKTYDIFVLILMSHGFTKQILTSDNQKICYEQIENIFSNGKCPNLAGKPKIIIYNCCRSEINDDIEFDDTNSSFKDSKIDDMVIIFSTLKYKLSNRDVSSGTFFCDSFIESLEKNINGEINDIVKNANEILKQKIQKNAAVPETNQSIEIRSLGVKKHICFVVE